MRRLLFLYLFLAFCFLGIAHADACNKTALVTGANRGVGFALTQALLANQIKVIAVVRDAGPLQPLLQKYPSHLSVVKADLSQPDAAVKVAEQVKAERLDYLIHNAAVITPIGSKVLLESTPQLLAESIQVNLTTPITLTAALGSKLQKGCRILNISSAKAGAQAMADFGIYSITKTAIDRYTESLQRDKPNGVLAASVHPGRIKTGMQDDIRRAVKGLPNEKTFEQRFKSGDFIPSETVAGYLVWLLSKTDDAYFVSKKHHINDYLGTQKSS